MLDQIEEDILAEFQSMRMPAPKVSKISDLLPILSLRIPPHFINTVSHKIDSKLSQQVHREGSFSVSFNKISSFLSTSSRWILSKLHSFNSMGDD